MDEGNETLQYEFILLGLTDNPKLKKILFAVFSVVYAFTVVGNVGIISLVQLTPSLHTPMYFFLRHLSFVDLSYCSTIAPRMLVDLLSQSRRISFASCVVQLFFHFAFGTIEALLLAAMAYDRYVAVCQPLHYTTIMTRRLCVQLLTAVYTVGILHSMIETGCTFHLPFCHWEIHHFCCDIPPLLKLSCTETIINEVVIFIFGGSLAIVSLLSVLISYAAIISAVLRMQSVAARLKVFSTCSSHFTGVTLYYGTIIFTYIRPSSSYSLDQDKAVTLFYTVVIPMLNPLIYSLRNKDVKAALRNKITIKKMQYFFLKQFNC
ncbi:olfactory receptor 5AR1-like [Ambystoma mexicanum]|uniref:olfactory receptor 5AR1-like n=1 Tax=Ambystoma mexicanum TaxID=8296 RepID=UPI0037E93DFC